MAKKPTTFTNTVTVVAPELGTVIQCTTTVRRTPTGPDTEHVQTNQTITRRTSENAVQR